MVRADEALLSGMLARIADFGPIPTFDLPNANPM